MNMKNFYKALFVTLMVGLLVITGCQSPFEPPASKAAGTGTLLVTVNGAGGRTILPAVEFDKYVLKVTDASDNVIVTRDLAGSAGILVPAGTYTVTVDGYIGEDIVATGKKENVTIASEQVETVNIVLEHDADGDGTFTWAVVLVEGVTGLAIEIYDIEDDTVNLFVDEDDGEPLEAELFGDFVLPAGVYNVKFTTFGEDESDPPEAVALNTWWEILYIYPGFVSSYSYDLDSVIEPEQQVYVVPASGNGYFYLDLNQVKTPFIGDALVETTIEADKITAPFVAQAQRLNFKLTSEQSDIIDVSKYIVVTINGTLKEGSDNVFRFFIGTPYTTGNWNATATSYEGAVSGILNKPNGTAFNDNKNSTENGFSRKEFLILQNDPRSASSAPAATLEITSVRIDYTTGDGIFFLDLSNWETAATQIAPNRKVDGSYDADTGILTATYQIDDGEGGTLDPNNQTLNIGLTAGQITLLGEAGSVDITLWGTTTDDHNFRLALGDPAQGTWNATDVSAGNSLFSAYNGNIITREVTAPALAKFFILQNRTGDGATVTLSAVRIAYTKKDLPPAVPATTDFVVFKAVGHWEDENGDPAEEEDPGAEWVWDTAPLKSEITGDYSSLTELNTLDPLTFPASMDIRSYKHMTIRVKYYLADGTTEANIEKGKQWAQVKIDGQDHYNLGEDDPTDTNCTIAAPLPGKLGNSAGKASLSLNFQARNTDRTNPTPAGTVTYVELHEFILFKD
jgi:hypothetical protein